ncbi:glycerol-3-phosphate 1-O-acyltransferase PlsY [Polynucleobacter sp. MWH-Loch1C5]|jgi:glycerol-3-phosphate acyltransferase PlsY|uniref:glycerol-3-phosphate 1-O-acyltransferase PlsY n=1 Tax=Polynucleobacter sp. MWH-Loch1C5 TaxID=2689108 RepID=UPI001C0AE57B|nr:glycerol-3-phosphate 1-O-acyltransferase PlsY [Polynucleobacter sp. MWH-Loch1C5]MBU3542148.1 glycerol-3-phosphate 1-O-acyltransferase PlsY [Polynucleobacter sp. MWH-Loch1C5]
MSDSIQWLFIPIAYFISSVSFAVVVSKVMSLPDPHSYGSGNPGATNVLRTGNKLAALLTLIGDALKGYVAVTLARAFIPVDLGSWVLPMVAVAAFVGHLYPIFHRFKGGKGVATALGILLAINWVLGVMTLSTWLIVAVFMRYSSLAALIAALFAPLYFIFLFGIQPMALAIAIMSALLIWRHQSNIVNLLNGTETRLGSKSKKEE